RKAIPRRGGCASTRTPQFLGSARSRNVPLILGKAKRAHLRAGGGNGAQERAFAHPTSDSSRSKSAVISLRNGACRQLIAAPCSAPFCARMNDGRTRCFIELRSSRSQRWSRS